VSHPSLPIAFRRALSCVLVVSAATVTACGRGDDTAEVDTGGPAGGPGPALAACNAPWSRIDSVPRDSILRWAGQQSFTTADQTLGRLYGFPEGASIGLTEGRSRTGFCWPRGVGCLIARLTTSVGQPDLGIPAGTSYVWADSAGGAARAVIIPEDAAAPVMTLGLGHHPVAVGDSLPASALRPPGVCMYCGDTCWCYFPTAGATSAPSILRLPGDTGGVRGGTARP
jgi:hypothetical protein